MKLAEKIKAKKLMESQQGKIVKGVRTFLKKHGISIRQLYIEYNTVHKKQTIPYATFYYKLNNCTFNDHELDNITAIQKDIEDSLKNLA